ncbi:hypothetical protein K443DRAFT_111449 [Laccaria amethystina LaAM-08-1]|uniref:Uncharacterized protein n=1 Tax=Laccaria amethystina LaAM-08-1 TaxID=1095629 RepID=A0A0C9XC67_9AGAR|nr:hypothetical protein K443DRAFT_111449 [Laccaria amethystina LaAM-08-1]
MTRTTRPLAPLHASTHEGDTNYQAHGCPVVIFHRSSNLLNNLFVVGPLRPC